MTTETVHQVRQWMMECSDQHETCKQYQSLIKAENDVPLRIIDVNPDEEIVGEELWTSNIDLLSCENNTRVSLKYYQEAAAQKFAGVKYLTLSHRWGKPEPTKLTWENMAEFSRQIPTSDLSKVFKDAIQVTRCLGFRYLWIDSICINQDNPVEKALEISRMVSIYRCSQLNLSATSDSGLIFQRDPKSVLPILRKKRHPDSRTSEDYGDFLMVSAGPWETNVDLGSLNERAWVLQERMLAPRVLHCCYNMVYWECPCLRSSEVDPSAEVDQDAAINRRDFRTNIKSNFVMVSNNTDMAYDSLLMDRLNLFHILVRSYYFPRRLTYSRDRLPAISGIARWFMERANLRPESYLAGLWQDALPDCLLWHFFDPPTGGAVRDPEAAPSWSWASIISNNSIMYGDMNMNRARALFQNLQPIIVPKDNDRFGQLEIATLRLHASIIPIEREWRTGAPHMRFPGENKWYPESQVHRSPKPTTIREHIRDGIRRIILNLMCRFETEDSDRFFTFLERQLYNIVPTSSCIQTRWDTTDMLWAEKTSHCPRQLYILPIALDCGKELSGNKSPRNHIIWGLILHRLPDKGQYGRVGMFMTGLYEAFRNPELSEAILGRMPKQALANFSIGI